MTLQISDRVRTLAAQAEVEIKEQFAHIDAVAEHNTQRVLAAFQSNRVAESYFAGTTGYGYDDLGRDKLDQIYAELFGTEDALVRILTEPRNALCRQYGKLLEMDGVELEFEPDALKAIAAKAIARKSGARGLRAIIEDALMGTMFDLPSRSDVAKVVVTPEVISEGKEPTLVPGEPKRKLPAGKTRREGDSAAANRRPSVS